LKKRDEEKRKKTGYQQPDYNDGNILNLLKLSKKKSNLDKKDKFTQKKQILKKEEKFRQKNKL